MRRLGRALRAVAVAMADHVVLWWLLAASPEWHEDVGADARCRSAAGALVAAHAAAAAARATFTADDLGARHNAWPVAVATASSVHALFATVLAWPTGLGLALAGVGATALLAGTRCCLERCLESLVKRVNRRARTDSPLGLSLARPRLLRVVAIVLASATASAMLALSAMLFAPVTSEGEPALPLLFLPLMLLVGALCLAVRPISWLLVALFDAQAPPHHLAIARIVIFGCWWWDMVRAPRRPSALAAPVPATSTARERAILFCKAQAARIVTARGATGARRYTDAVVVLPAGACNTVHLIDSTRADRRALNARGRNNRDRPSARWSSRWPFIILVTALRAMPLSIWTPGRTCGAPRDCRASCSTSQAVPRLEAT